MEKKGASMLRSSGNAQSIAASAEKGTQELEQNAKELFEWMDVKSTSRIRMMLQWQGAGGLPYVASVHHLGTQCFRYLGNALHEGGKQQKGITMEEWQEAVKERHRVGSSGMEDGQQAESIDFKAKT